jgi:hypothetical protein
VLHKKGELVIEGRSRWAAPLTVAAGPLGVKAGDTIDFALDIDGTLKDDQFEWDTKITKLSDTKSASVWHLAADFQAAETSKLDPWEQLAKVLLSSNEFLFID